MLLRINILFLLISICSCTSSDDDGSITLGDPKVYIAGNGFADIRGFGKYLEGSQEFKVASENGDVNLTDIFVSDGDIYIAGNIRADFDLSNQAVYWKNGVFNLISDQSKREYVSSIFVRDGVVHAVGYEQVEQDLDIAKYWIGTSAVELSDGIISGRAYDIVLSGSDVHICGITTFNGGAAALPVYWKNNEVENLEIGTMSVSRALDIAFDNNTVYISGFGRSTTLNHDVTCIWINGQLTEYADNSINKGVLGLSIYNGDYYIGGYGSDVNGRWDAFYYRNDTRVVLRSGNARRVLVSDLWVHQGSVYVVGHEEMPDFSQVPRYWIDGIQQDIQTSQCNGFEAIFVE